MKQWIIVLSLLSTVLSGFSQRTQRQIIDSTYRLLVQHPDADTQRLYLLNRYARLIRHDSAGRAMELADEALELSRQLQAPRRTAEILSTKSMIYSTRNQYDSCILYGDSANDLFEKYHMLPQHILSLNLMAENYYSKGELSMAIDIFHRVIGVSERAGIREPYGVAYANIGNIYWALELFAEAIENYEKGLTVFREINDSVLIGAATLNIGLCHTWLGNLDAAEAFFQQSHEIFVAIRRPDVLPAIQTGLAMVYVKQGRPLAALPLLDEALGQASSSGDLSDIANAQIGLAKAKKAIGDSTGETKAYYEEALVHAQAGLSASSEIREVKMQSWALEEISDIYQRLGNYRKAYESGRDYRILRDSVFGSNKKHEIAIKQVAFDQAAKQAISDATHQAALDRQATFRNFIVATAMLIMVVAALLFIFYKRRRDARAKQVEAELMAEISSTEMKALRAQMNPHFIFNCLNAIVDYISKNRTQSAKHYLTKFARLMRMILEHSEQREVPLSRDLEALELYIQLESLRFDNQLTYTITVDSGIDPENTFVPSLMLQPFVENSIWHGLGPKQGRGRIAINVGRSDGMLHCTVEDDGVGRRPGLPLQGEKKSFGITITQSRIDMINKLRHSNAALKVSDLPSGTRVDILLPVTADSF